MGNKFYLTTAIDYANGEPHLGHAFEKVGADCIARYRRLRGDRVHFVIGMDEHGQKVAQAAEDAGVAPQAWVDDIAGRFQVAWGELGISHDDFIRTTEVRHRRTVQELFRRIQERGHIYEGVYKGYYCVGCEGFKLEKDLDADGRCPIHPTREIKWVEEPNFFFRLSSFGPWLLERYAADPTFVRPKAKMNEIRNVVTDGLQDISVSRARVPWGIPWPGDESHTVYVWFEALINYLSATGFPDERYTDLWPADLHVIGPDIVRFHAAMWPAMLDAAGLEPPRGVWSHGWINTQGERFSKSAGVRVSLREIIDRHGSDALRYFLLREVPWDGDGNFSFERFDARYTADLADGYGNLVSRVLAMIIRYLDGVVPAHPGTNTLHAARDAAWTRYTDAMDGYLLHEGAAAAMALVAEANGFIEARAPWTLAKQGEQAPLADTLGALADTVAALTVMLAPFLPTKTATVWHALGNGGQVTPVTGPLPSAAHQKVLKVTPLFPKPPAAS
ncbi:MAG: methionine--tRNA ligase [Gemmatimonadota bacterium]|nr:methionine--tRNA ligase [Gemmatimonadota bacterium]MDH4350336.1 methionine--tRNA ligase [Gemmatimonadota bacterium]